MNICFNHGNAPDFDPLMYVRILVAITKADPSNSKPEMEYVRQQAAGLPVDFDQVWAGTDRTFEIDQVRVSRHTALTLLKDCIALASLDGHFSLTEKERVYVYAEKLNIPRRDIQVLEAWVNDSRSLQARWEKLVSGELL
jgi:hypothetical protein